MALLRLMATWRQSGGDSGRLVVAHFDHGWRGAESAADARFVADLARSLGLACELGRAPPLDPRAARRPSEAPARRLRYGFLSQVAGEQGCRAVVTAHTADDQAETVLHHLFRGTGLRGLAGMAPARELLPGIALVRPLLGVRRAELAAYLAELDQPYRVDSTNLDRRRARNRLRHDLLPRLERWYGPGVIEAVLRAATLAGEAEGLIQHLVEHWFVRVVIVRSADQVRLDAAGLSTAEPYLIREVLRRLWRGQRWPEESLGRREWDRLEGMVTSAEPVIWTLPGAIRAERHGSQLSLRRGGSGDEVGSPWPCSSGSEK